MRLWTYSLLLAVSLFFAPATRAAVAISITSIPDTLIVGNSFTLSATASGLVANATYNIKFRLGTSTAELTKGQTFNSVNTPPDDWLSDTSSWSKFPVISADVDGKWSGDLVARAGDGTTTGQNVAVVRLHKTDTGQNSDSTSVAVNVIASPTPTPSPTPQPTSTPGPSNTPSPSPTTAPTITPTLSPTPKASVTPKISPTAVKNIVPTIGQAERVDARVNNQGQLLALEDSPPPDPDVLGQTTEQPSKFANWLPIGVIGAGILGLAISLILLFRHARQQDILSE